MLSESLKEQMPLFSEDHKSGERLTCWWRTYAWECSEAWEMPMQSRSASVLFYSGDNICVCPHFECFTGIPKTRWAFSYPETLFVGDPLPKGLLQNPVYAAHPQYRSKGALALKTWIITLCPWEGWGSLPNLNVRELCSLPDLLQLLWMFSLSLANFLQISGSWRQGPYSGCLASDRQQQGQVSGPREEQDQGNIQVPERGAYTHQ